MSATPTAAPPQLSLIERHHFLLRRLHSLSGIVPVGLFVIFHLFTNAQMIWPDAGATFQHEVDFIHSMPALLFIEISLWVGIGFHAALGLVYTFTGQGNVKNYSYSANLRYTLQRITGILALIFIFFHIATLRWRWDFFGWFTPFYGQLKIDGSYGKGVPMSMPLTAYALQYSWIVVLFYVIGVASVVYHWANGLWTAAISWGLTITPKAQQRWGAVCLLLFIALTAFWGAAIYGALAYSYQEMTTDQKIVFMEVIPDGREVLIDHGVEVPSEAEAERRQMEYAASHGGS